MGSFSIWHWLIVLVIIMMVFGTKKLRNIGSDLGSAVKGFKEGMREGSEDKPAGSQQAQQSQQTAGQPPREHSAVARQITLPILVARLDGCARTPTITTRSPISTRSSTSARCSASGLACWHSRSSSTSRSRAGPSTSGSSAAS